MAEWLLVAAIVTALVAGLTLSQATFRADAPVYDTFSKLDQHSPSDDIVIVAIDNRSIAALGRWPWPRSLHADLLRRLAQAKPKATAYDVLFVESDPATDADLAKAVEAAAPTFLPLVFDVPGENGAPFRALPPAGPLRDAAAGIGQVNVAFDPDGIVRRAFLSEGEKGRDWPHLMEWLYRTGKGAPSAAYASKASAAAASGLVRDRPVSIAFAGPAGSYRTVSFVDLLQGQTPDVFLRDKLVLVGATADGLGDRYTTPISGVSAMPGVELQANLLETLLTGRDVRPLPLPLTLAFSLAPVWILLLGFLKLRPRANMLLGAALIVGVLGASALLFLVARLWAPPVTGLIGLLLVYPLWSWRRLEAISAYMVKELDQFASESDLLPSLQGAADPARSEVIDRQVDLMRGAIRRARDLRGFVTDTLQGIPDPILVTGLDNRILISNREADVLFAGVARGPLTDLSLGDLPPPFDLPMIEQHGGSDDYEITASDGRTFNARRTPLSDAQDRAVGWIVRLTDISALKAAGRQREDILQLLTHDMRSPQVSILALLDQNDAPDMPGKLTERIGNYARRTLALADNFVHVARAETSSYAVEPVNFSDVLVEAADDLWPQAKAKDIVIETHGCDDEYLILADRTLLTRALINLINNAVKYSDAGSRVVCRLANGQTDGRPTAVCTIADSGRGMTAEQVKHLFERFWRAPAAAGETQEDGVGLGLVFVQTVITRHGGSIICDSRIGEGATFTITLPRLDDADQSA